MGYIPEIATLGAAEVDANSFEALNQISVPPSGLVSPWPWRVLIAPLSPDRKTKGGIILADDTKDAQDYLVSMGRLLDIGPQAFTGKRLLGEKLDGWMPRLGDWVWFGRYAGQRMYNNKLKMMLVLCNDDDILGLVGDPRDWKVLV